MHPNYADDRSRMSRAAAQLLVDETGQDLVEYALITAFIGVVGILLWENIRTGIGGAYANWDSGRSEPVGAARPHCHEHHA